MFKNPLLEPFPLDPEDADDGLASPLLPLPAFVGGVEVIVGWEIESNGFKVGLDDLKFPLLALL